MGRSRSGDERQVPEPAHVGEVLRGLLTDRRMSGGLRLGRVVRVWREVVGERLAGETRPVALDEGRLVVAATGPGWAAQTRFLGEEIRRRANDILGEEVVASVRVVVGSEGEERRARRGGGGGRR